MSKGETSTSPKEAPPLITAPSGVKSEGDEDVDKGTREPYMNAGRKAKYEKIKEDIKTKMRRELERRLTVHPKDQSFQEFIVS